MENKRNPERCLLCGGAFGNTPSVRFPDMPASAQNIPDAREKETDEGITLNLRRCPKCGLWQFDCAPVEYYRDVIRAVGLSETMRSLRREDYAHLMDSYALSGGRFLECGCGRGEFLKVLQEFDACVAGTEADPASAAEAAALLAPSGRVYGIFPEEADMDIPGRPFDCFLSFNFLEHQPDPSAMLLCMNHNLREGGYGLITVPSFEYILEGGNYYELIKDHIAGYDLPALERLVTGCGFEVLEKGRIGIGDTLRMIVRKVNEGTGVFAELTAEEYEGTKEAMEVLSAGRSFMEDAILKTVENLKTEGCSLALWGAGHQGFTIASTTALGNYAEFMVDSAPFKQGRFTPASHLPIVSPAFFREHPTGAVMITAPGYTKEISAAVKALFAETDPPRILRIPGI